MAEKEIGGPVVRLGDVGQIAITVQNLAKAKAFYKDVLGLTFLFDAGTMVFFQCGPVRLMLGLPEGKLEDTPASTGTILYFKVADLPATIQSLKDAGVLIVQEPNMVARMPDHELWLAAFKDPEGNVIDAYERVDSGGVEEGPGVVSTTLAAARFFSREVSRAISRSISSYAGCMSRPVWAAALSYSVRASQK